MRHRTGCLRLLAGWGLGAALAICQAGCLSFIHPAAPLPHEEIEDCLEVPQPCKNHVYVYFVHGLDPVDLANLYGLEQYVRSLGFIKTYYGAPYHAFYFDREVRRVRACDPEARFVLVGFSYGAGLVRDLACGVGEAGIDIDLIVYLDGVVFDGRGLHRPRNVAKVLNVLSFGRTEKRNIPEAINIQYDDSWHYGTVTHPTTLRLLSRELTEVASRVPLVQFLPAPLPEEDAGPARKLPLPETVKAEDGSDFLAPDGYALGAPGAKPTVQAFATLPLTAK